MLLHGPCDKSGVWVPERLRGLAVVLQQSLPAKEHLDGLLDPLEVGLHGRVKHVAEDRRVALPLNLDQHEVAEGLEDRHKHLRPLRS
eukprot:scaffold104029_cov34-Prasinocladus_malaysianus.AAC.1